MQKFIYPLSLAPRFVILLASGCAAITYLFPSTVMGQSGGPYVIEKAVIAPGGGAASGGTFQLDGTIAQSVAGGPAFNSPFLLYSGFWAPNIAPTAAPVTISGRVRTTYNRGIGGVIVTIFDLNGNRASTRTSTFGYYRFPGLAAGETYVISVSSAKYVFDSSSAVVTADDNITGLDFVSQNR